VEKESVIKTLESGHDKATKLNVNLQKEIDDALLVVLNNKHMEEHKVAVGLIQSIKFRAWMNHHKIKKRDIDDKFLFNEKFNPFVEESNFLVNKDGEDYKQLHAFSKGDQEMIDDVIESRKKIVKFKATRYTNFSPKMENR